MPAWQVLCEHVVVLAPFHEAGEELIDWPEQAVDRLAVLATAQRQQHSVPVRYRPEAGDEFDPRRVRFCAGRADFGEHGCHLGDGPFRECPDQVEARGEMAIDRATDDTGSGGDVAHSGVGVLSQHIEGDVEDAIACLVHRAHTGGLGRHDIIVAHQRAMK